MFMFNIVRELVNPHENGEDCKVGWVLLEHGNE